MKKTLIALCTAAAVVLPALAQSTFETGGTLAGQRDAVDARTGDQSYYANQNRKYGTIVRQWQFDVNGAALANLELGEVLQDGAAVVAGYVQVLEAVQPGTATNAISIASSGDIIAVGTTLNSTGLKDIVPQDHDIDNAVVVTDTNTFLTIDFSGSLPTQGVVQAVLNYFLTVP